MSDHSSMPEGRAIICAELSVDLKEMRDWPPHLIRLYFDGIAIMLRASAGAGPTGGGR